MTEFIYTRIKGEKKKKDQHAAAWGLLSDALKDYGLSPMPPVTVLNKGKPVFTDIDWLFFSISHSEDVAACVVSDEGNIGLDVQKMNKRSDPLKIGKRFFHPDEYTLLSSTDDEEARRLLFFKIFSSKEAFVKMTGDGMSRDFRRFKTVMDSDTEGTVYDEKKEAAGSLKFHSLPLLSNGDNYVAVTCLPFTGPYPS
ncbi:MAG: 4'-phosphopantetheinyl transferase superfamily protein [Lachnospiraceae bacterium]|nr:4'-phosphopantetheinyl transferase superfamily protein [Lachnospiraceae bacterium]